MRKCRESVQNQQRLRALVERNSKIAFGEERPSEFFVLVEFCQPDQLSGPDQLRNGRPAVLGLRWMEQDANAPSFALFLLFFRFAARLVNGGLGLFHHQPLNPRHCSLFFLQSG